MDCARVTMKAFIGFVGAVLLVASLNAKGRITKSDGLEYEITKEGKGQAVISGQRVQVHYSGWLNVNGKRGKLFDSSRKKNKPFIFALGEGQVIRGWDEGVAGMKRGEKRILYVPAMLGYGSRGAGDVIPPDSNLIFEVELLDFE
jgi:FKBP-type peptidyl-prolyl cis-trans isomerase FkpA